MNRGRQVVENSEFYVDKTDMLAYLNRWLFSENRFVCVSGARRIGKSIAAKIIAAYYDKIVDSRELFANFEIARHRSFEKGLNKFNVLYLDAPWSSLIDAQGDTSPTKKPARRTWRAFRTLGAQLTISQDRFRQRGTVREPSCWYRI